MASKYSHINENWPYHQDPHGNMVPCASNPCKLHSGKGTDLMIIGGPDEANIVNDKINFEPSLIQIYAKNKNVILTDEIKNELSKEMLSSYNKNQNFNDFYAKYGLITNDNGNVDSIDFNNNAFKELLSRFNVSIPNDTDSNSINSRNNNDTNAHEKVSLKRAVPKNNTHKSYSTEQILNRQEFRQLKNNAHYSNKIGLRNGTYYIQCSPVNDNDTGLKRASKIHRFCMIAESMGLMKTKDANMIDNMFNREGVVLEFTAHNDEEVKYLFRKVQELANDYDDGNGFIVYNNRNNKLGHDYVTTFNTSADDLRNALNSSGLPSNLKCYEYKNEFNQPRTIIDSKNNSIDTINVIKDITAVSFNQIKTNVYTIRKEY